MSRLISFSGYAFAGKDAAADTLVEHLGYYKTYMSKPLEQALLTLNPWVEMFHQSPVPYSELHKRVGYDESKKNPEVRRLLQLLGTEVGRKMFSEDAWLNLVMEEISEVRDSGQSVALTGVRYKNELDRVRAEGGITVWVHRPGVEPVNTHSSEHTLTSADCDFALLNDSTVDVMYNRMRRFFDMQSNKAPLVDQDGWNLNPSSIYEPIGQVLSDEPTEKGLEISYALPPEELQRVKPKLGVTIINHSECEFGESQDLTHAYGFRCKTHDYNMFMPIDKAPERCDRYVTEI